MSPSTNGSNPLGEVFGFPITNESDLAKRFRSNKLCPFNNKSANCTKDKANDPLGVCSIMHHDNAIITCPSRFREDWLIIEHAAQFAFPGKGNWTSIPEVRLVDKNGESAGNIDFVIVLHDSKGNILDFASLEVQGVYISGNLRNPFEAYQEMPSPEFTWPNGNNSPKPDYLSSSRKRLIPQMLHKGGIFHTWKKKQAVALQRSFFETLPQMPQVSLDKAEIAWLLYDLIFDSSSSRFHLKLTQTIYTDFESALFKVTTPEPGEISDFIKVLRNKFEDQRGSSPETIDPSTLLL